jgi:exonuclease VII small subunit
MDGNTLKIAQEKCSSAGGQVEIEDVNGCQKLNCKITGSYGGGIGQMGMDQNGMGDARQKCESMGLTADVIQGLDGYRIECVEKGYQQVGYVDKEIDATEALEFVFKLEEIKMKLDEDGELYNRVDNLYKYCKEKGEEDCSNYENAMAKMSEAREAIGSLREQMKTSIEQNGKLTVDNLYMFKSMTRSIIEQNLMTIAYALLGVDMSAMETEPIEIGDCGSEAACFEEKFRSCAVGSSVSPGEGVTLTIKNLDENGNCQIDIETDAGTATCNFKEAEYKYMPLSKEAFNFETCGEELEAILPKETQKYNPGEIGGKETYCKVTETCDCDEVCEENDGEDQYCDDCMRFGMCGDGLCEPKVGEDSSNCPADCIGPSEEVVLEPVEEETPTEEVPVEETPTEEVPAEEVA